MATREALRSSGLMEAASNRASCVALTALGTMALQTHRRVTQRMFFRRISSSSVLLHAQTADNAICSNY